MQRILFVICVTTIFIVIHVLVFYQMLSSIDSNPLQNLLKTQILNQKEQTRNLSRKSSLVRLVPFKSHNANSVKTPEGSNATLEILEQEMVANVISFRSGTKNTHDENKAVEENSGTKTTTQRDNSEIQNKLYDMHLDIFGEREKKRVIKEKDAATSPKDIFKLNAETSATYNNCRQTVLDNLHLNINETPIEKISRNCPKYFNISSDISALFERRCMEENMLNIPCVRTSPMFLNKSMPLVALASFPGSGNSWVRQILEAVTGVYTGSVYTDVMASFKGSKRCPATGKVFIVKTHKIGTSTARPHCPRRLNYEKAVFILRNPYDAIMAEFNRVNSGKVGVAKEEEYVTEKWNKTVQLMSDRWRSMVGFWLTKFKNPVYTLVYDQLKTNIAMETYKVMEFIDFPVTLHTLYCLTDDKNQEKYLRAEKPAWLTKENLYSRDLKELVNANIAQAVNALRSLPYIQEAIKRYAMSMN